MAVAFVIWLVVGVALWAHYKLAHGEVFIEDCPQRTIPGALLWPIFFAISLTKSVFNWMSRVVAFYKA
jgi:hypothetical protein